MKIVRIGTKVTIAVLNKEVNFTVSTLGSLKTYDPQGGLVSEGPIDLAIEQGTEINELRLTNQPDCVFVLTTTGETGFTIPNYNGGADGTVNGEGGFNGKTVFFIIEGATGSSQFFGSK